MSNPTASQIDPYLGALLFAGFFAVVALFAWLITRVIPRKISRWNALVQRFPTHAVHKFGGRFGGCTGFFGGGRGSNLNGAFLIECAQEGLSITASFARQLPILIPWSVIGEVQQIDTGFGRIDITVTVDFERRMGFYLPVSALPELQQNVPPERFRAPTSLSEMMKDRLQNLSGK